MRSSTRLGRETIVDAVVAATPLEFTNYSLPDVGYRPRPYQATYVALAAGRLSREVFGARADDLDTVLTVETTNVSFSCIGAHGASTGGDPIYKVMSRRRLSDDELDAYVFERGHHRSCGRTFRNASGAYTNWSHRPAMAPFVLRNRLFYANMESPSRAWRRIISGKNAALLVVGSLPLQRSCVTPRIVTPQLGLETPLGFVISQRRPPPRPAADTEVGSATIATT